MKSSLDKVDNPVPDKTLSSLLNLWCCSHKIFLISATHMVPDKPILHCQLFSSSLEREV